MSKRRRGDEGRIKAKVRALMLAEGWEILTWWEQHGDYRIHKYHWDVACWGCTAFAVDGKMQRESAANGSVQMACWSTMGECAKFGLSVNFDRREGWQINPKTEEIAYDNMQAALGVSE